MVSNQGNDPNGVPQQDPNQMTLLELEQSQDMPPEIKTRAQRARTEMSISIAGNGLEFDICRSSKLWHPHQNEMAQFPGGIHKSMHHSYIGNYAMVDLKDAIDFRDRYPNIRSLNIILNLVSADGRALRKGFSDRHRADLISGFGHLVAFYAKQLVSFKLWVRGELHPEVEIHHWYSVLTRDFADILWEMLEIMTQCRVLWLDLMEVAQPVPEGAHIVPPEVYKLAHRLHMYPQVLTMMQQLEEFRFAADYVDPFTAGVDGHSVLYNRLVPIATLQRIHFRHLISAEEWITVPQDVARRFQENDIIFEQPFGQLVDLFHNFNALNRVAIFTGQDGPRFGAIFQALTQVANLQVLDLTIMEQPCLFTPEEVYFHRRLSQDGALIRTPRLLSLQVLAIELHLRMQTCADITVAPLFPSGDRARQLPNPLPSLITFDMSIPEGECLACANQDQCIRQAVIQWFEPQPNAAPGPIASVIYTNAFHPALRGGHVVRGRIRAPQ